MHFLERLRPKKGLSSFFRDCTGLLACVLSFERKASSLGLRPTSRNLRK